MLIRHWIFALFLLSVILPMNLSSSEKANTRIYLETFVARTFWENAYAKDGFDEFGPGLFVNLKLRQAFGNAFFEVFLTWHYSKINGPDGLTITGSDDDCDSYFRTRVERKDISFKLGYNLGILGLSVNIKRNLLQLNGTHRIYQKLKYEYYDKGFMFGPGLSFSLPLKRMKILLELERLSGNLDTFYKAASKARPGRFKISSQLFDWKIGVRLPIAKSMDIDLCYKSENYYKEAKSWFDMFYFNPTDLWNYGLMATYSLHF